MLIREKQLQIYTYIFVYLYLHYLQRHSKPVYLEINGITPR